MPLCVESVGRQDPRAAGYTVMPGARERLTGWPPLM